MKWLKAPHSGLWIIIYMLIFSLSQQLAFYVVTRLNMDHGAVSFEQAGQWVSANQVPFVLAFSALIGLPLLFITVYQRRWDAMIFQRKIKLGRIVALFLLGMLFNYIASLVLLVLQQFSGLKPWFEAYRQSMDAMVPNQDPRQLILLLGLVVPIYEEVLFRGLIFREFAAAIPIKWAIIAQALLFGVWHSTLIQGIYAFVLGLLLCRTYLRHQSIWAACAIHCGFNTASYWWLYMLT